MIFQPSLTSLDGLGNRDSGVLHLARCDGNRLHTQEGISGLHKVDEKSSELTCREKIAV
jgi:hypothetical protein